MLQILKGWCKVDGDRLFSVVPSERSRGNGHLLRRVEETADGACEHQKILSYCVTELFCQTADSVILVCHEFPLNVHTFPQISQAVTLLGILATSLKYQAEKAS